MKKVLLHVSVLLSLGAWGSCARVADPLPPLVLLPKHAESLEVSQVGERVQLRFPAPTLNTDGSRVQNLLEVRVYRLSQKSGAANEPVELQVFRRDARLCGTIPAGEIAKLPAGRPVVFEDDLRSLGDGAAFGSTLHYAVEFMTRKNRSDGLSTFRRIDPIAIPAAPAVVRSRVLEDGIVLEWDGATTNFDGSAPARLIGYNVYRSLDTPPRFEKPLNAAPIEKPEFVDRDVVFGREAGYAVSVVGATTPPSVESPLSTSVRVTPRDVFPPAAPARLEVLSIADTIGLRWDANRETDVGGYYVYRSLDENDRGSRLNIQPVRETGFVDRTAERPRTYYYRITAVDRIGNESPPSASVAGSLPAVPLS